MGSTLSQMFWNMVVFTLFVVNWRTYLTKHFVCYLSWDEVVGADFGSVLLVAPLAHPPLPPPLETVGKSDSHEAIFITTAL